MAPKLRRDWPVLRRYDPDHLGRIALPLGGIGTGTVSLGGRGDLRDWEVANCPAKGFRPAHTFFALWAKAAGARPVTRCVEGALPPEVYEGERGATAANHGLPRFRRCAFAAAYPFAQVLLADPAVPLAVRLEAFNPLVPADADASGLPVALLRFVLVNRTARRVQAALCASLQNFIGTDGSAGQPKGNVNAFRTDGPLQGLFLRSEGVDPTAEAWGTLALATTAKGQMTRRTAWAALSWGDSLLDFWDDFAHDGRLDERDPGGADAPVASLAVRTPVPARGEKALPFLLAWHFPNRTTWTPADDGLPNRIGNYYTTQFADAWAAAAHTAANLPRLERDTLRFVRALCRSDLPPEVLEAALCNLSTLRSQTCFRTPDGRFYGWEGCCDRRGCCHGSCTHVWNYEQATAFLFGTLARSMRQVEFAHATKPHGGMNFRVSLPLEREARRGLDLAAADGQMGCLLKLHRDWQLSGDEALLRALWPAARRALEFAWTPGGWDADRDGVMEGCQHNTMDVEYYGPNPQMGLWYLGALRAAEEMAGHLGEADFAATCRALFNSGSAWLDAHLFNGQYYEHQVRPPRGPVAQGLRHASMGARDPAEPDLRLGPGCLVDQLVGQVLAHVCGLGHLVQAPHLRKALRSIRRHNFQRNLTGHFNHLRTFALNDEAALLMATYPRGRRPKRPFPYFNEVMTGFEYTAAIGMLYEGMTQAGLECIRAIRRRYDGHRRNPFNEAECGHHYARAMASWGAVLALTGFHYRAVTGEMTFAAADEPTTWFWSTGGAWGTVAQRPARKSVRVELRVLHGSLKLRTLTLTGLGSVTMRARTVRAGRTVQAAVERSGGCAPPVP